MRVRQPDNAYKNRQEKVPITFIFLLSTHLPPPFAYIFLLYAYFSFRVFTFKKKESFIRVSICVCVCVCVFRIFWKTAKLQFAMQSQQNQQLRSHACKLPYNLKKKKKLKISNSKCCRKFYSEGWECRRRLLREENGKTESKNH